MKMASRARGQCTGKMLPRLILLAILLAAGGLAWADRPAARARALSAAAAQDGSAAIGGCIGGICANRSGRSENFEEDAEDAHVDGEAESEEGEEDEGDGDGSAVEEGRGRKGKKKKGYGKILMLLAGLTKAAMLYIMIHAVAALAGKALIVAKVALAIATALALKKSLDHKTTSYEIVKHPQYSHVQTHSSSVDYDHSSGGSGGYESSRRRRRRAFRR